MTVEQIKLAPLSGDTGDDGMAISAGTGQKLGVGGSGVPFGDVVAKTNNYTVLSADKGTVLTFNGSNKTATLPASAPAEPWMVTILNLHATALTISPNGLEIQGGSSSITIAQNQAVQVFSDGANYFVGGETPSAVVRAVSFALGNMGATPSVDLGSVENQRAMVTGTLNANAALTLANLAKGQVTLLLLTQDGTGGRTLSINGTAATIPGTAGASCVVECDYDGTSLFVSLFGGGGGSSGAMTLISDKLLVATAASFDFTAIPGTYKHLKVMLSCRTDVATNFIETWLRFNGDSTAGHYINSNVGLYGGDGGTALLNQRNPNDKIFLGAGIGTSAGAGKLQVVEASVPDYAGAVLGKGVLFTSADFMDAAAGYAGGGLFEQTPAVTELTIFPNSGNFIAGSRCSLYGIS